MCDTAKTCLKQKEKDNKKHASACFYYAKKTIG